MIKKKHPVTLIELLIAMTLTSILISTLLYFFRDIDWINNRMEQAEAKQFERLFVQNRLADVLTHIVSPRSQEKDFYFYTSKETYGLLKNNTTSLVFTHNFGSNRDALFGGHVLSRLYVDENNTLGLAMWPSPKRWEEQGVPEMKKEVLLTGVEDLQFRFYVPPKKERKDLLSKASKGQLTADKTNSTELNPDTWYEDWQNDYAQLPAIIEILLTLTNNEKFILRYPLPMSDFFILYEGEGA